MINNVIFGMGIFHTANGLQVLGQAKINVRQMSRGDSFGCVIFKILWDNGAKTQPRQNTGYIHVINILTLLHSERPKLHMNLAFLSAIGLKSQFVFILQWFKSCFIFCKYFYISSHRFLKTIKKAIHDN